MFECTVCSFSSEKHSNYLIHLETKKHRELSDLNIFCGKQAGKNYEKPQRPSPSSSTGTADYFPFANRLELLLYIIRGSKYHQIDQELFKFILHIIRVVIEEHITHVPPFHRIWNYKVNGLELKPSVHEVNGNGSINFIKPSSIIELQLSKEDTAKKLQRYPTDGNYYGNQSSGKKWRSNIKAIMAKNSKDERFYIGDIVQIGDINGEVGTISEFVFKDFGMAKQMVAVMETENSLEIVEMVDNLLKTGQQNKYNGADRLRVDHLITKSKSLNMDIISVPVNVFVDDTSGNRSKKWNPFNVWTLQLAGLPSNEMMKKSSHHFIGVTNNADHSLAEPVVDDLNDLFFNGKVVYDAASNAEVIVTSTMAVGIMDNAMAVEFCHLMGPAAKENCRFCRYGSNPLAIGQLRTKEQTEQYLKEIGNSNSRELSTFYGVKKQDYAQEMNKAANWDPHRDIPPDLLHCRYLGDVSILLRCVLDDCSDLQKENLQLVINSCNWNGLHHKCGENFIKYHKSCQGKDFKAFVQLAPFIMVRAKFSKEIIELWCILSELIQLLNRRKLSESELSHIGDIQIAFNTKLYEQYPDTKRKQKIHHNLHTEEMIRQHGVPIGYTTEAGESWCGIVKHSQSTSNHHNPNRDTAIKMSKIEEICHLLDDGSWVWEGKRHHIGKHAREEVHNPLVRSFLFGHSDNPELNDKKNQSVNKNIQPGDIMTFSHNDSIHCGEVTDVNRESVDLLLLVQCGIDHILKCQRLKKSQQKITIDKSSILKYIYVMHDCINARCGIFMDPNLKKKFRHNYGHQVYLVNKFKINFDYKL